MIKRKIELVKRLRVLEYISSGGAKFYEAIYHIDDKNRNVTSKVDIKNFTILEPNIGDATDEERQEFLDAMQLLFINLTLPTGGYDEYNKEWAEKGAFSTDTDLQQELEDKVNIEGSVVYLKEDGSMDDENYGNVETPEQVIKTYNDTTGLLESEVISDIPESGTMANKDYKLGQ